MGAGDDQGMNNLEKRIVELSYRHKLTHISSCLNTANLLADIYAKRKDDEPVVLGNSHAALALYVVLESHGFCDAEEMIKLHGVHAGRDLKHGIWCSGGSLGQAETVAVGMALADKSKKVWLVTSDGAIAEGAVFEAFRIANCHCPNLKIHVVFNGFGAYGPVCHSDLHWIPVGSVIYYAKTELYPEWLQGLPGHYLTLSAEQHAELMR